MRKERCVEDWDAVCRGFLMSLGEFIGMILGCLRGVVEVVLGVEMGAGPGRVAMPVPGAAAAPACMSSMCWTPPSSESGDISLEGMASCSTLLIVICMILL